MLSVMLHTKRECGEIIAASARFRFISASAALCTLLPALGELRSFHEKDLIERIQIRSAKLVFLYDRITVVEVAIPRGVARHFGNPAPFGSAVLANFTIAPLIARDSRGQCNVDVG